MRSNPERIRVVALRGERKGEPWRDRREGSCSSVEKKSSSKVPRRVSWRKGARG